MFDDRAIHQLFHLVDREQYESLDYYQPDDELLRVVRALVSSSWRAWRKHNWFHVQPAEVKLPRQGWKIHVSASITNCEKIFCKATTTCIQMEDPFKFALDRHLVFLSNFKGWPGEASGKFIEE